MSLKRLLIAIFCAALSVLPVVAFAAEPAESVALEFSLDSRLFAFERTADVYGHGLMASIGLGWTPNLWITVHGRIGMSWGMFLDEAEYRYHNQWLKTSHLGNIEVQAVLDFHPGVSMLSIRGELGAESWFTAGRAGVWRFTVGVGFGVLPFESTENNVLRNVYFGFICRFAVYDDFKSVFELRSKFPELGIQVTWGF